jgi:uncharacterized protein YkwD
MVSGGAALALVLLLVGPVGAAGSLFDRYQQSVALTRYGYPYSGGTAPSTPQQPAPAPAPTNPSYGYPYYGYPGYRQPAPAPTPPPTTGSPVVGIVADEQLLLQLMNQDRARQGLAPLQLDSRLTELARLKAQDIVDNNYYAHVSPTYGAPWEMLKKAGITYRAGAENLTKAPNAAFAHAQFMYSTSHRTNILNPVYTHVGIGVVRNPAGGIVVCQLFIKP